MADIVTSQDSVDLQNKSIDLIWKEGKLFLTQLTNNKGKSAIIYFSFENPLVWLWTNN